MANVTPSQCQKYANMTPCQCQKNAFCDAIWVPSITRRDEFLAFLGGNECKKWILSFVSVFLGAISLIDQKFSLCDRVPLSFSFTPPRTPGQRVGLGCPTTANCVVIFKVKVWVKKSLQVNQSVKLDTNSLERWHPTFGSFKFWTIAKLWKRLWIWLNHEMSQFCYDSLTGFLFSSFSWCFSVVSLVSSISVQSSPVTALDRWQQCSDCSNNRVWNIISDRSKNLDNDNYWIFSKSTIMGLRCWTHQNCNF